MSGSSNDGGIPSINPSNSEDSCETLVINTNLSSPQAAVIQNLSVGDFLSIQAASDQGPVQAIDSKGAVAGSIMTREQIRLLNCIIAGTEYEAEILHINNGQCNVIIRAV